MSQTAATQRCPSSPLCSVSEKLESAQEPLIASSDVNFRFTPPVGGDVCLTSSDGVDFIAHSSILGGTSSTFADMFSIGTKTEDVIILADDAEAISLMLAAIYRPNGLSIRDFSTLEKVLHISQKYDIEGVVHTLDTTIPMGLHGDFLEIDLFRTFQICTDYGLQNTSALAAKAVQRRLRYFQDREAVAGLAGRLSGGCGPIVGLAGTVAIRAKILHDVLYDFRSGIHPPDSDIEPDAEMLSNLLCTTCYKMLRNWNRFPDLKFRPHWLFDWARIAFNELVSKDIDECGDLFDASVFGRMIENSDHPYCVGELRGHESIFNDWAGNVKSKLIQEFSELDKLYQF